MKKIIITVAVIVAALVVGILLIRQYEPDTEVTDIATKVGVILNGSKEDKSWSQSHYHALQNSAEELNLDITYKENVSVEAAYDIIAELIVNGSEIIIANSAQFGDSVVKAAEDFPEVCFYHATGVSSGKNLCSYFGRMYQMRYLSGIAAGLQTKTNKIGYVAAFPIPEVNRGINAFTLGVRSVNPEAEVYVRWINSWVSDSDAEAASRQLASHHNVDILTMHTDSITPLKVADELGIMSIGYNTDNSALYPDSFLTAAVWDWESFYIPNIYKCLQGKFEGTIYWDGSDTGIIALAPLSEKADSRIAPAIDEAMQKLNSGTFDVFYGPISDNQGYLRIPDGESMTDNAMLNEFDWYVEGVVIDE